MQPSRPSPPPEPTLPGGLAPLSALPATPGLHPLADQLVMGVLRQAHADEGARGNIPGQRAIERMTPALAEAVAALLRIRIDGLVDIETR